MTKEVKEININEDDIFASVEESQAEMERHQARAEKWAKNWGIQHRIKMFARNTDFNSPKIKTKIEVAAGGGSYTDGINIRLGLPENWFPRSEEDYVRFMKFVAAHEYGHVNWSDFVIFKNFKSRVHSHFEKKFGIRNAGEFGGNMLNITEDGRIERAQVNELPGLLNYVQYVNGVHYEEFKANHLGIIPLQDFVNTCLQLSKTGLLPNGFEERCGGTDTEVAVRKAMPFILKAIRAETPKECADATWEIIVQNEEFLAEAMKPFEIDEELLKKLLSEDMSGESGETGESGESDSSSGSEENSNGEGDGEGEEEGSDEEGNGKKIEINPLDGMNGESDYKNKPSKTRAKQGEESAHFGDESDLESGEATSASGMKQKQDDGEENSADILGLDKLVVLTEEESVDFMDKAAKEAKREGDRIERELAERQAIEVTDKEVNGVLSEYKNGSGFRYVSERTEDNGPISAEVLKQGRGLKRDLNEIFNDKRGYTLNNQRSGMLDESQLYRAGSAMRQTDVFIKKQLPEDTDWVVSILVDNSGSMSGAVYDSSRRNLGPKTRVARHASTVLELALNGLVPFKIARFDVTWGSPSQVQHARVRGWEQKTKDILSWNSTDNAGGGNADAMSIGVAIEELKNRPENKKLLFVLSDGLPAENTPAQVKKVIEEARKDGVKVVGIGFGPEEELESNAKTYHEMYGKDIVLTMPDGLSKELVKVLRKTILRG